MLGFASILHLHQAEVQYTVFRDLMSWQYIDVVDEVSGNTLRAQPLRSDDAILHGLYGTCQDYATQPPERP